MVPALWQQLWVLWSSLSTDCGFCAPILSTLFCFLNLSQSSTSKATNTYGSLAGYIVGLLLRILGGEAIIGLPPVINYFGMLSANNVQLFPFKSFCMLMTFVTIIIVSFPIKVLFEREILPKHLDVFQCVVNISEESIALRETLYEMNGDTGSHSKREAVAAMHSKINPALKFSKEDLLSVPEDNLPDASPIDNDPPTKIKDES